MKKRGNIVTSLVIVPFLIMIMAFMIILAAYTYTTIRDETDIFTHNNESLEIQSAMNTVTNMYSYIFVMYLVAFFVIMGLAGYYIDSSPVFLIVGILVLMVAIIVAVPVSNAYEDFISDSSLAATAAEYGIMTTLMNNLPIVITFLGGLFLIVLYAKKAQYGGNYT